VQSSPYLKRLYRQYNKKYFGGCLPKIWLIFGQAREWRASKLGKTTCAATFFEDGVPIGIAIRYYKNKSTNYFKTDLLHELIHVANPRASHGPAFKKELRRLMAAGAFDNLL
jgi:hypothetical protein